MSKRKLKEVVGIRQKYRRISEATKQFVRNRSEVLGSTSLSNDSIVSEDLNESTNFTFITPNVVLSSSDTDDDKGEQTLPNEESAMDISADQHTLSEQLTQWALTHRISQTGLTALLHLLSPLHPELPLDSRTLLSTPSSTTISNLETGQFIYFGIKNGLSKFILGINNVDKLQIGFNVDGIPLFKSSKLQFWPILALIKNIPCSSPFPVSIFCGKSKPKPLNLFLEPFIDELNDLLKNGLVSESKKYFSVEVHSFVCDAPARAYLKCTKSHTGYSACDKCTVHGEYFKNKVVLDSLQCHKRTDESFRQQLDEDHHISQTPLTELPIDLIKTFPIDYMHNICLGIMRKLLHTWIGGPLKTRLPNQKVKLLSERLLAFRNSMPIEFNRKPRSLDELQYWKATEFRTFLVYLGPCVLKDVVDTAIYENFILFHFFVSILLSKIQLKKTGIPFVRNVVNVFIGHLKKLYGLEFMIYNVHLLSHICDDVELFGELDNFSAFPFENYLGVLKSLISKRPTNPLQQIHRRLMENGLLISKPKYDSEVVKPNNQHTNGPLIGYENIEWREQFLKLNFYGICLSAISHSKPDCYTLTIKGNKVVEIHNIVKSADNGIYIIGKEFLYYSNLYSLPYPSSELNVFLIKKLSVLKIWSITEIYGKCIVSNHNDSFVAIPLLHALM